MPATKFYTRWKHGGRGRAKGRLDTQTVEHHLGALSYHQPAQVPLRAQEETPTAFEDFVAQHTLNIDAEEAFYDALIVQGIVPEDASLALLAAQWKTQ